MAQHVNLDAMIPREDFARTLDEEVKGEPIKDFPLSYLESDSPIRVQLRKPDFQRETNHWTPEQLATFIASFLDQEVIPSLILWRAPSFIFVIDGGHRLSALRAWMVDDYGDGAISQAFYNGEITDSQKRIAKRARTLIENKIGRYSTLRALVGQKTAQDQKQLKRAGLMFTRPLQLQWVYGDARVAETSFFKINSQGTPLDDVEAMLIENRAKPLAIAARAIMRAGSGHKYWSMFQASRQEEVEALSRSLFRLLFKPEASSPLRTLDVPLGGSSSPVDALSLIIDFLTVAGSYDQNRIIPIDKYESDTTGENTEKVLRNSLDVANRITGNSAGSLGLHPAVYFYTESGKHSRFLFLGIASLFSEKVRNNDTAWFKKFTSARSKLEDFLINEKSLIGLILRAITPRQRMAKAKELISWLVDQYNKGEDVSAQGAIAHMGVKGRIFDGASTQAGPSRFTNDVKSLVFIDKALNKNHKCSICGGHIDSTKSMSYDHLTPVNDGGSGGAKNLDLVHPYCNTGIKGAKNQAD